MKRISLIVVLVLTLFISQAVVNVSAGPLNSFAENPISYWDDDSLDVAPTWDSTEQTVKVEYELQLEQWIYYESMEIVTDWTEDTGNWESGESISTDGDIGTFSAEGDGDNDVDGFVVDVVADMVTSSPFLRIRYKLSALTADLVYLYIKQIGNDPYTPLVESTDWVIRDVYSDDWLYAVPTTSISIMVLVRADDGIDIDVEIDYIYIIPTVGNLDIGIPIISQDTQEIEVYVNSTNLNSEVRLELYDDTEALDTYCTFNSTHVIFPDLEYAQTDGLSRIQFSLDNARMIGTITVFDEDSILINQYNDTSLISGTTFLRMNDSVFNGSFILIYLNGDTTYTAELSFIEELFFNTNMIGYFGPLGLVIIGYLLTKKEKALGIFMVIVDSLVIAQYLALLEATPDYWWQVIILLLGVILCAIQMIDR